MRVTLTMFDFTGALEDVEASDEIGLSTLWRVDDLVVRQVGMGDPEDFAPPHGARVLLLDGDEPVAGGAFRRHDGRTAELKRIWTSSAHRKRGLGRRVVIELEILAAARGYRRIYLTTGPRQPEAHALYLASGYKPLFDLDADPETLRHLAFEKSLPKY